MELLHFPLTLLLYLSAAVLAALGARLKRGYAFAFAGGLFWAAGSVDALVEGVPLDELLCVTLALLLASTGPGKRRAAGG